MDPELKRQIMIEHYQYPFNKETKDKTYITSNGNIESCIDNINLYLKIENNIIKEAFFDGEACAVSTSSTSIMLKNIINKTTKEALDYANNFENMVNEKKYNKEILKEGLVYDEIYKQESRKTCATLPYKALREAIAKYNNM